MEITGHPGQLDLPGLPGQRPGGTYQVSTSPTAPATGSATWTYTNPSAAANFYTVYVTWPACAIGRPTFRTRSASTTVAVSCRGRPPRSTVNQQIPLTTNGQANGPLNPKQTYAVTGPGQQSDRDDAWTWLQLGGSGAYSSSRGRLAGGGGLQRRHGQGDCTANQVEADAVDDLGPPGSRRGQERERSVRGRAVRAARLPLPRRRMRCSPRRPNQSGTTTGKTAGAESDAWWLLYGEE